MFRKAFIFLSLTAAATAGVMAQTPEPKTAPAIRSFAWTMDGDGGYLGVQTKEVTKENFGKFGLRDVRGVAVEKVLDNSPAAVAGLQTGDVIVKFENEDITSVRKLTRLIGEVAPDHQVTMTILRNGSEQTISATLGKRPGAQFGNGNFEFAMPSQLDPADIEKLKALPQIQGLEKLKDLDPDVMPKAFSFPGGENKAFEWRSGTGRQIGVGVTPLTKQLASHFGVDGGLMISEVRDGSPASKAGLKAGDIIVEADGKALKGQFDLIRSIGEKKDGDVNLTIVRDGRRQNISVTPEISKGNG
ncbi:MAG: PDZ domain-containing protein, partial [Acidobacteriota bacterium]